MTSEKPAKEQDATVYENPLGGGNPHLDGPRSRQLMIAEAVIKGGTTSVERLAELTDVSLMTIYRDIAILEERGILQRHRGQVVAVASGLHEADAEFRLEQSSAAKRAVASAAVSLIPAGSSLMLDDSTSGVWLLRALGDQASITVVTNSLLVASEVAQSHSNKLVVTGGEYQPWSRALMGNAATGFIRSLHADFCVISTSGISRFSCFHPYQENAEIKRAMLDSAENKILLVDHTKFTRRALYEFATLQEFTHVVIDAHTPEKIIATLEKEKVNILVAR
ncbi:MULTISPECIES: DeoR/GlpR family DNA-binding transcription regulator [unclassified Schaalia]|uniref:DeoR/GlpR family DNA-binding transcription regulator n=1 Tax=unclassified Schaalia TaxID=2691889 RepID=UPI001E3AC5D0|nr:MULTISPECIES: DeoR/GlpR family DNA-binding transcription regulator [unclassified Schaalia]MCD4549032.1 DeoR/GlpR family DNA-binding transcription regulator [Schaalia sp. lx-260]MCD4557220.1 DeoR/GlpR family DNA-binding transcription regulator [Schaalia sp. lx-100]